MENITVKDIVGAAGGRLLCGDPRTPLVHISIDSRQMRGADLFVPLIGEKNDAHRFIGQAMKNGASASLTSEHDVAPAEFSGALIRVGDTKKALQEIGSYLRDRIRIPVVGITGSVGKTTTREMVAAALSAGFRVFKTPANHNSQVGVPLTISEIGADDEIAVLELGMSEPGEMHVIAEIARVDLAVITNVGVTHIENLGSRDNILREKLNIQDGMRAGGTLFLNGDNDLLSGVSAREGLSTVYYGTGEHCACRAEEIRLSEGKASFVMAYGDRRVPIALRVMGEHNVLNALAALAVADACGVPPAAAAAKLETFDGFQNRQQIRESKGVTVIDDTYNASPDSMRAGIRVLSSMKGHSRRIAVLADMKELGEDALRFHREIGTFLAGEPVDVLVTYGTLAAEIAAGAVEARDGGAQAERGTATAAPRSVPGGPDCAGAQAARGTATAAPRSVPGGTDGADGQAAGAAAGLQARSFAQEEREAMTKYLRELLRPGDAVLFKGSNSMKLGETAAHFAEIGEER